MDSVYSKTRSEDTIVRRSAQFFCDFGEKEKFRLDFCLKEPVCAKEFWNCILMFCIKIQLLDSYLVLRWAICAKKGEVVFG